MSLANVINIAGTGMNAQSIRLNTTASNLANAQSVSSSVEDTYRARKPVFEVLQNQYRGWDRSSVDIDHDIGNGVNIRGIVEKQDPLDIRYEPTHPSADADGYVYYPNVNIVEEMADMISASRSFTVNVEVFNTAKTMMQKTLTMGQ